MKVPDPLSPDVMALSGSKSGFAFGEDYGSKQVFEDEDHERKKKVVDMLEALWLFLPPDINDCIIKKVPLEHLLRWRLVSKHWNRVIMCGTHCSTPFTNNIPLISRLNHSTLVSLSAYNEKAGRWCSMDMAFLLPALSFEERILIESEYISSGRLGLLFLLCTFQVKATKESWVIICNPVTKKYTEVKLQDERTGGRVLVICHEQQQHYELLLSYKDDSVHHVYSSRSGSWKQVTGPTVDPHCIFSPVSNHGCLYFLKNPRYFETHRHATMGAYDPSANTWSEIHGLPRHIGPDSPRLLETGGHLLFVARTLNPDRKVGKLGWCFYRMEGSASQSVTRSKHVVWTKVREMPLDVYTKLNTALMFAPIYREIRCVGEGNHIFFAGSECTCRQRDEKRTTNEGVKLSVVVHDFRRNTWTWLPAYTDTAARFWYWETNSIRMLSFWPSLAAVK